MGALSFLFLPTYQKEYARVEIKNTSLLVELARDPQTRARGLAGRTFLAENGGMLFIFREAGKHAIWMKGMKIPIDIFWIRNGRVVDLEENVLPSSPGVKDSLLPIYRPEAPAGYVLETKAGFAAKYKVSIGDEVKIFLGGALLEAPRLNDKEVSQGPPISYTATTSPGAEYFIETLREKPPRGKDFRIIQELGTTTSSFLPPNSTRAYRKFLISYNSGDIPVTGIMNVPTGEPPPTGFPILILAHGLIRPEIYFSGRGSKREQDFFASHGYLTIHPDYRWHALSPDKAFPKEKDPSPRGTAPHDFYVGYTEDIINLLDALRHFNSPLLDVSRIGMWGHSMGGGIATRVMVLRPEIRAYVLFAPLSAAVEDNFYELGSEEMRRLANTYGVGEAARAIYEKISPLTYFGDVQAPVQIHHGIADKDVPIEFSEKIFERLSSLDKKVEFYKYPEEGHEFGKAWQTAAERALQFFDRYVKNAR